MVIVFDKSWVTNLQWSMKNCSESTKYLQLYGLCERAGLVRESEQGFRCSYAHGGRPLSCCWALITSLCCLYRLSRASTASLWRREEEGGREVGMLRSIGRRSLSADIQRSAIGWWSQIRRRKAGRFNLLFSALSLCFSFIFSLSVFFSFLKKPFLSFASGILESSLKPFHFLNSGLGCVHTTSGAATNAGRVSRQLNRGKVSRK